MKNLITLVALIIITLGSVEASIVCKKRKGRWYPVSKKAISIAKMLNVKTCTGKRFKAVLVGLGETSNVVVNKSVKSMSVEAVLKEMSK